VAVFVGGAMGCEAVREELKAVEGFVISVLGGDEVLMGGVASLF
jgi:hypothetical protein